MLFMTAKLNLKKIAIIAAAVIIAVAALVLIFGKGEGKTTPTAGNAVTTNDDRVDFLKSFGWDVSSSPTESGQVRIPDAQSPLYERYNSLQKSQGYDLTAYAGKAVMRYVYKVNNYPGATEPVYATLLIYKNTVIGGDITDTSAKGTIHPLTRPQSDSSARN